MFKNDARFTHSGDPDGRRALALVKPEGALFEPKPGDHLFKGSQQIPEKGARQPFKPGLPEKEISLPDPLVQQAIARTLAGVSSKGFQLLSPKTMAQVTEISKTAPRSKAEEREAEAARAAKATKAEEEKVEAAKASTAGIANEATANEELAGEHQTQAEALTAPGQETGETVTEPTGAQDGLAETPVSEGEASQAAALAGEPPHTEAALEVLAPNEDLPHDTSPEAATEQAEALGTSDSHTPASPPGEAGEPRVPEGMQLVSAADIQQMFDEAFAQGQQAGREEAQAEATAAVAVTDEERQAIEDAAYQKGYDEGYAKADSTVRDELQAEVQLVVEDLRDLTQKMAEAAHDTNNFYAPLLKLATHLAEQLVRGELTLSGQAIARLVQTSLEEFDKDPSAPVLVRLNPEDLARIEGHGLSLPGSMTLKADATLTSGSVKVQMNGALIEDLIEDRAEVLWHSLTAEVDAGAPPPSFLQNVALVKEAFEQVDSVIDTSEPDEYSEELEQASSEETK